MLRAVLPLLLLFSVLASPAPADDLFQKGLAAYQNRKYDEAREDFEKILGQGTVNARLLHNLALTYYQLNQKPHALALWRKALTIDPSYRAARAGRDMLEGRFNMRPFERDSLNAWLRQTLAHLSLFELLWLLALVLSMCGWLWLRYLGERRAALDEERPLPVFPWIAGVTSAVFFCALGLLYLKTDDLLTRRATVVLEKSSVRSLPAEEGVGLFDLTGGSEVLVRQESNGWTQIQSADGSTGWVKSAEILITSER